MYATESEFHNLINQYECKRQQQVSPRSLFQTLLFKPSTMTSTTDTPSTLNLSKTPFPTLVFQTLVKHPQIAGLQCLSIRFPLGT
jgi:hypothetical protein